MGKNLPDVATFQCSKFTRRSDTYVINTGYFILHVKTTDALFITWSEKKTNMAAAQSGNSITKVLESICRERRRENLDKESEGKFKAWRPTWAIFKDGQSLNFANSIRAICQVNWPPGHMKVMCECGYDWSEVLLVNTALSFFAITWCFLLKMEREYVDFRMQKSELLAKFDWQFFEIIGQ